MSVLTPDSLLSSVNEIINKTKIQDSQSILATQLGDNISSNTSNTFTTHTTLNKTNSSMTPSSSTSTPTISTNFSSKKSMEDVLEATLQIATTTGIVPSTQLPHNNLEIRYLSSFNFDPERILTHFDELEFHENISTVDFTQKYNTYNPLSRPIGSETTTFPNYRNKNIDIRANVQETPVGFSFSLLPGETLTFIGSIRLRIWTGAIQIGGSILTPSSSAIRSPKYPTSTLNQQENIQSTLYNTVDHHFTNGSNGFLEVFSTPMEPRTLLRIECLTKSIFTVASPISPVDNILTAKSQESVLQASQSIAQYLPSLVSAEINMLLLCYHREMSQLQRTIRKIKLPQGKIQQQTEERDTNRIVDVCETYNILQQFPNHDGILGQYTEGLQLLFDKKSTSLQTTINITSPLEQKARNSPKLHNLWLETAQQRYVSPYVTSSGIYRNIEQILSNSITQTADKIQKNQANGPGSANMANMSSASSIPIKKTPKSRRNDKNNVFTPSTDINVENNTTNNQQNINVIDTLDVFSLPQFSDVLPREIGSYILPSLMMSLLSNYYKKHTSGDGLSISPNATSETTSKKPHKSAIFHDGILLETLFPSYQHLISLHWFSKIEQIVYFYTSPCMYSPVSFFCPLLFSPFPDGNNNNTALKPYQYSSIGPKWRLTANHLLGRLISQDFSRYNTLSKFHSELKVGDNGRSSSGGGDGGDRYKHNNKNKNNQRSNSQKLLSSQSQGKKGSYHTGSYHTGSYHTGNYHLSNISISLEKELQKSLTDNTTPPLLQIQQSFQEKRISTPSIIVCGARNHGKSSFFRYLVNSFLNYFPIVAFMETDVGQTEFTAPGIISITFITTPLLGLPYQHQVFTHHLSTLVGDVDLSRCSSFYMDAVKFIYTKFDTLMKNPEFLQQILDTTQTQMQCESGVRREEETGEKVEKNIQNMMQEIMQKYGTVDNHNNRSGDTTRDIITEDITTEDVTRATVENMSEDNPLYTDFKKYLSNKHNINSTSTSTSASAQSTKPTQPTLSTPFSQISPDHPTPFGVDYRLTIPLLVNTPGWTTGLGKTLLTHMVDLIHPETIIEINDKVDTANIKENLHQTYTKIYGSTQEDFFEKKREEETTNMNNVDNMDNMNNMNSVNSTSTRMEPKASKSIKSSKSSKASRRKSTTLQSSTTNNDQVLGRYDINTTSPDAMNDKNNLKLGENAGLSLEKSRSLSQDMEESLNLLSSDNSSIAISFQNACKEWNELMDATPLSDLYRDETYFDESSKVVVNHDEYSHKNSSNSNTSTTHTILQELVTQRSLELIQQASYKLAFNADELGQTEWQFDDAFFFNTSSLLLDNEIKILKKTIKSIKLTKHDRNGDAYRYDKDDKAERLIEEGNYEENGLDGGDGIDRDEDTTESIDLTTDIDGDQIQGKKAKSNKSKNQSLSLKAIQKSKLNPKLKAMAIAKLQEKSQKMKKKKINHTISPDDVLSNLHDNDLNSGTNTSHHVGPIKPIKIIDMLSLYLSNLEEISSIKHDLSSSVPKTRANQPATSLIHSILSTSDSQHVSTSHHHHRRVALSQMTRFLCNLLNSKVLKRSFSIITSILTTKIRNYRQNTFIDGKNDKSNIKSIRKSSKNAVNMKRCENNNWNKNSQSESTNFMTTTTGAVNTTIYPLFEHIYGYCRDAVLSSKSQTIQNNAKTSNIHNDLQKLVEEYFSRLFQNNRRYDDENDDYDAGNESDHEAEIESDFDSENDDDNILQHTQNEESTTNSFHTSSTKDLYRRFNTFLIPDEDFLSNSSGQHELWESSMQRAMNETRTQISEYAQSCQEQQRQKRKTLLLTKMNKLVNIESMMNELYRKYCIYMQRNQHQEMQADVKDSSIFQKIHNILSKYADMITKLTQNILQLSKQIKKRDGMSLFNEEVNRDNNADDIGDDADVEIDNDDGDGGEDEDEDEDEDVSRCDNIDTIDTEVDEDEDEDFELYGGDTSLDTFIAADHELAEVLQLLMSSTSTQGNPTEEHSTEKDTTQQRTDLNAINNGNNKNRDSHTLNVETELMSSNTLTNSVHSVNSSQITRLESNLELESKKKSLPTLYTTIVHSTLYYFLFSSIIPNPLKSVGDNDTGMSPLDYTIHNSSSPHMMSLVILLNSLYDAVDYTRASSLFQIPIECINPYYYNPIVYILPKFSSDIVQVRHPSIAELTATSSIDRPSYKNVQDEQDELYYGIHRNFGTLYSLHQIVGSYNNSSRDDKSHDLHFAISQLHLRYVTPTLAKALSNIRKYGPLLFDAIQTVGVHDTNATTNTQITMSVTIDVRKIIIFDSDDYLACFEPYFHKIASIQRQVKLQSLQAAQIYTENYDEQYTQYPVLDYFGIDRGVYFLPSIYRFISNTMGENMESSSIQHHQHLLTKTTSPISQWFLRLYGGYYEKSEYGALYQELSMKNLLEKHQLPNMHNKTDEFHRISTLISKYNNIDNSKNITNITLNKMDENALQTLYMYSNLYNILLESPNTTIPSLPYNWFHQISNSKIPFFIAKNDTVAVDSVVADNTSNLINTNNVSNVNNCDPRPNILTVNTSSIHSTAIESTQSMHIKSSMLQLPPLLSPPQYPYFILSAILEKIHRYLLEYTINAISTPNVMNNTGNVCSTDESHLTRNVNNTNTIGHIDTTHMSITSTPDICKLGDNEMNESHRIDADLDADLEIDSLIVPFDIHSHIQYILQLHRKCSQTLYHPSKLAASHKIHNKEPKSATRNKNVDHKSQGQGQNENHNNQDNPQSHGNIFYTSRPRISLPNVLTTSISSQDMRAYALSSYFCGAYQSRSCTDIALYIDYICTSPYKSLYHGLTKINNINIYHSQPQKHDQQHSRRPIYLSSKYLNDACIDLSLENTVMYNDDHYNSNNAINNDYYRVRKSGLPIIKTRYYPHYNGVTSLSLPNTYDILVSRQSFLSHIPYIRASFAYNLYTNDSYLKTQYLNGSIKYKDTQNNTNIHVRKGTNSNIVTEILNYDGKTPRTTKAKPNENISELNTTIYDKPHQDSTDLNNTKKYVTNDINDSHKQFHKKQRTSYLDSKLCQNAYVLNSLHLDSFPLDRKGTMRSHHRVKCAIKLNDAILSTINGTVVGLYTTNVYFSHFMDRNKKNASNIDRYTPSDLTTTSNNIVSHKTICKKNEKHTVQTINHQDSMTYPYITKVFLGYGIVKFIDKIQGLIHITTPIRFDILQYFDTVVICDPSISNLPPQISNSPYAQSPTPYVDHMTLTAKGAGRNVMKSRNSILRASQTK